MGQRREALLVRAPHGQQGGRALGKLVQRLPSEDLAQAGARTKHRPLLGDGDLEVDAAADFAEPERQRAVVLGRSEHRDEEVVREPLRAAVAHPVAAFIGSIDQVVERRAAVAVALEQRHPARRDRPHDAEVALEVALHAR